MCTFQFIELNYTLTNELNWMVKDRIKCEFELNWYANGELNF